MGRNGSLLAGTIGALLFWSCTNDSMGPEPVRPQAPPPLAFAAAPVPVAPGITIESLGAPTPGSAQQVNESGRVMIRQFSDSGVPDRALAWTEQGGIEDLGDLGNGSAEPTDMNEAGTIVGLSSTMPGSGNEEVFRAVPGQGMMALIPPEPYDGPAVAADIDDTGTMRIIVDLLFLTVTFIWDGAFSEPFLEGGPLPPPLADDIDTSVLPPGLVDIATDQNTSGQIVGRGFTLEGRVEGFVWDPQTQAIQFLGVLAGHDESIAFGINDQGEVVGVSRVLSSGLSRAVLWIPAADSIVDLGTLPGHDVSEAFDINNASMIVGGSWLDADESQGEAVLWRVQQGDVTLELTATNTVLHPRVRQITVNGISQPEIAPGVSNLEVTLSQGGVALVGEDVTVTAEVLAGFGHAHVVGPIPFTSTDMAVAQAGPDTGLPIAGHFDFQGNRQVLVNGPTDSNGMLGLDFVAGHLGTRVQVIATADVGGATVADTVELTIAVPDLVDLEQELTPQDPDIYWIGSTGEHPQNWYIHESLTTPLEFTASAMRSSLNGTLLYLQYNDASLPQAGVFTLAQIGEVTTGVVYEDPFARPHRSHANGRDIDIAWCYAEQRGNDDGVNRVSGTGCVLPDGVTSNPLLRVRLRDLTKVAAANGGVARPHNNNHYHIRFR